MPTRYTDLLLDCLFDEAPIEKTMSNTAASFDGEEGLQEGRGFTALIPTPPSEKRPQKVVFLNDLALIHALKNNDRVTFDRILKVLEILQAEDEPFKIYCMNTRQGHGLESATPVLHELTLFDMNGTDHWGMRYYLKNMVLASEEEAAQQLAAQHQISKDQHVVLDYEKMREQEMKLFGESSTLFTLELVPYIHSLPQDYKLPSLIIRDMDKHRASLGTSIPQHISFVGTSGTHQYLRTFSEEEKKHISKLSANTDDIKRQKDFDQAFIDLPNVKKLSIFKIKHQSDKNKSYKDTALITALVEKYQSAEEMKIISHNIISLEFEKYIGIKHLSIEKCFFWGIGNKNIDSVKFLSVRDCQISFDDFVSMAQHMPNLEYVEFKPAPVTYSPIALTSTMPFFQKVESLNLIFESNISEYIPMYFISNAQVLEKLSLKYRSKFPYNLEEFTANHLKELTLYDSHMYEENLLFNLLRNSRKLKKLTLKNVHILTKQPLADPRNLVKLPDLEELILEDIDIDIDFLMSLIKNAKQLKKIKVHNVTITGGNEYQSKWDISDAFLMMNLSHLMEVDIKINVKIRNSSSALELYKQLASYPPHLQSLKIRNGYMLGCDFDPIKMSKLHEVILDHFSIYDRNDLLNNTSNLHYFEETDSISFFGPDNDQSKIHFKNPLSFREYTNYNQDITSQGNLETLAKMKNLRKLGLLCPIAVLSDDKQSEVLGKIFDFLEKRAHLVTTLRLYTKPALADNITSSNALVTQMDIVFDPLINIKTPYTDPFDIVKEVKILNLVNDPNLSDYFDIFNIVVKLKNIEKIHFDQGGSKKNIQDFKNMLSLYIDSYFSMQPSYQKILNIIQCKIDQMPDEDAENSKPNHITLRAPLSQTFPLSHYQEIGEKDENFIYDTENTPSSAVNLNRDLKNQNTFSMKPMVQKLNPNAPHFNDLRCNAYLHDFSSGKLDQIDIVVNDFNPYLIKGKSKADYVFEYQAQSRFRHGQYRTRLRTLPAEVELLSLEVAGLGPNDYTIAYSEKIRFYEIITQKPLKATVKYAVVLKATPKPAHDFIEKLVSDFRPTEFYHDPRDPQNKPQDFIGQLNDVITHPQYYSCDARSSAFFYYYTKHKADFEQHGITDCFINNSGTHAWVELEINGKFHAYDLGGSACTLKYEPVVKPIVAPPLQVPSAASGVTDTTSSVTGAASGAPTNQVAAKKPHELEIITQSDDFDKLLAKASQNTLLVFDSIEKLEAARAYIRQQHAEQDTLMCIDQFSQLQTSAPYIHLDTDQNTWNPALPPGGLAHTQLTHGKTSHILIDWHDPKKFSPRQTTQINTCIDTDLEKRHAQGVKIDPKVHIIGLILKDDPRLKDASFLSRHHRQIFKVGCPLTVDISPDLHVKTQENVELYNSTRFKELMFGSLSLNGDSSTFEPGPLMKLQAGGTLTIHNPPLNSPEFERLVSDLRQGGVIRYHDQLLRFKPLNIIIKHGFDYTKRSRQIASVCKDVMGETLGQDDYDHVLNPLTFERCLYLNHVDKKDKYGPIPGTLVKTPGWIASHPKETITFYITRGLSTQQYCALFDEAKKRGKRLHLLLAPGVILPSGLNIDRKIGENDFENIPRTQSSLIAKNIAHDYSRLNLKQGDILFDVTGRSPDDVLYGYENCFNESTRKFEFNETQSAILSALTEMPPRRVFLTGHFSKEMIDHLSTALMNPGYIWHHGEKKYIKGELILVCDQEISELNWVQKPEVLPEPLEPFKPYENIKVNEQEDAIQFPKDRVSAVLSVFKTKPMVLVHGLPGTGKSSFVRYLKGLAKARKGTASDVLEIFNEHDIEAWGRANPAKDEYAVLVIDEALLRRSGFMNFASLNTDNPILIVRNVEYHLSPRHKIMFLGNITKNRPKLFDTIQPLEFGPLSRSYIIHHILTPIFAENHSGIDAAQFYDEHKNTPVRELQGMAIAAACAKKKQLYVVPGALEDFTPTESRNKLLNSLVSSLNARAFMQTAQNEPARFGGQTAVWVEGAAGIGKTEIITQTLKALGFHEYGYEDLLTYDRKTHKAQAYYRISASVDPKTLIKCIRIAFQQGLIVVIDELDTALSDEHIAEINGFLMGEDFDLDRPEYAGFTLIATGNGITYAGREGLHESLRSRMKQFPLSHYTKPECEYICGRMVPSLDSRVVNHFIDMYMEDPVHFTFRDLRNTLLKEVKQSTVKVEDLSKVVSQPIPTTLSPSLREAHSATEQSRIESGLLRLRLAMTKGPQLVMTKRPRLAMTKGPQLVMTKRPRLAMTNMKKIAAIGVLAGLAMGLTLGLLPIDVLGVLKLTTSVISLLTVATTILVTAAGVLMTKYLPSKQVRSKDIPLSHTHQHVPTALSLITAECEGQAYLHQQQSSSQTQTPGRQPCTLKSLYKCN